MDDRRHQRTPTPRHRRTPAPRPRPARLRPRPCPLWPPRRALLLALALLLPARALFAQQGSVPPPPAWEAPFPAPVALPPEEQTPPILPKLAEIPPPPCVELPPLPPACAPNIPDRPLTANEAACIALHYQASLLSAQGQILVAQGKQQQASAALGLQATVNATVTRSILSSTSSSGSGIGRTVVSTTTGVVGFASTLSGTTLSVTVQQLLFDFHHTRELVRQAASLTQAAQANLTVTQSNLVYQVKQDFYQYVENLRLHCQRRKRQRQSTAPCPHQGAGARRHRLAQRSRRRPDRPR